MCTRRVSVSASARPVSPSFKLNFHFTFVCDARNFVLVFACVYRAVSGRERDGGGGDGGWGFPSSPFTRSLWLWLLLSVVCTCFFFSCYYFASLRLPFHRSCVLCTKFVRNESEKRTQGRRRRRQSRRKSWYDDGDNIVWSRIACAFYFKPRISRPPHESFVCTFQAHTK